MHLPIDQGIWSRIVSVPEHNIIFTEQLRRTMAPLVAGDVVIGHKRFRVFRGYGGYDDAKSMPHMAELLRG